MSPFSQARARQDTLAPDFLPKTSIPPGLAVLAIAVLSLLSWAIIIFIGIAAAAAVRAFSVQF